MTATAIDITDLIFVDTAAAPEDALREFAGNTVDLYLRSIGGTRIEVIRGKVVAVRIWTNGTAWQREIVFEGNFSVLLTEYDDMAVGFPPKVDFSR